MERKNDARTQTHGTSPGTGSQFQPYFSFPNSFVPFQPSRNAVDTELSFANHYIPLGCNPSLIAQDVNPSNFLYVPNHANPPQPVPEGDTLTEAHVAQLDDWLDSLREREEQASRRIATEANSASQSSPTDAVIPGQTLYERAYYRWLSPPDSLNTEQNYYNPFGSDDVFVHHNTPSPPAPSDTANIQSVDDKVVGSKVTKSPKPTFADIAKNRPRNLDPYNSGAALPDISAPSQRYFGKDQPVNTKPTRQQSHTVTTSLGQAFQYVTSQSSSQDDTCSTSSSVSGDTDGKKAVGSGLINRRKATLQEATPKENVWNFEAAGRCDSSARPQSAAATGRKHSERKKSSKNKDNKTAEIAKTVFRAETIWADSSTSKVPSLSNNEQYQLNNKQKHSTDKKCLIDSIPKLNTLNTAASAEKKGSVKASTTGTTYINNDLRSEKNKEFSQTHARGAKGKGKSKRSHTTQERSYEKTSGRLKARDNGPSEFEKAWRVLGDTLAVVLVWIKWGGQQGFTYLGSFLKLLFTVTALLCAIFAYYGAQLCMSGWAQVKIGIQYLQKRFLKGKDEGEGTSAPKDGSLKAGLKENISLPATGQEAMKRLLSCKGKDPYSILGVRCDTSDDDIKRYYRRQAVLVHPDKNKEPGAEEAFKILGHAFDLIGTEEKRQEYNSSLQKQDAETAMEEFADLLSKLNDKIKEASNLLQCDKCKGQHKRVPVERPAFAARFCSACDTYHQAKEGDIWAESKVLGFLWHYYACMEGKIFDITTWVSCKRDDFQAMRANSHQIFYKLSNTNNRRRRSDTALDDLIQNLLSHQNNRQGDDSEAARHPAKGQPTSKSSSTSKGKKKKKRH